MTQGNFLFDLQLCKSYFKTVRVFLLPTSDKSPMICFMQIFKPQGKNQNHLEQETNHLLGSVVWFGEEMRRKREHLSTVLLLASANHWRGVACLSSLS